MSASDIPAQQGKLALVILTGLSGAGKTLALRRLEDTGFFCADNLPFRLLPEFVEQCKNASPGLYLAAVVIDSREAAFGTDWEFMLHILDKLDVNLRIIFLDCKNETLLRRYSETRRRHPLASGGDILTGIMRERALLQTLRERANAVIDTSDSTPLELMAKLEDALALRLEADLTVNFMSFGYKRGLPIDADIVLDMRFLPNPFYDPVLRPLSGLDAPVREFLMGQEATAVFLETVETMLLQMLPGFGKQGKQHMIVAFGCTGGRHRSVFAASSMQERFEKTKYHTRCVHRDFENEAKHIQSRFQPDDGGQT